MEIWGGNPRRTRLERIVQPNLAVHETWLVSAQ
jgi:hypothetical protein